MIEEIFHKPTDEINVKEIRPLKEYADLTTLVKTGPYTKEIVYHNNSYDLTVIFSEKYEFDNTLLKNIHYTKIIVAGKEENILKLKEDLKERKYLEDLKAKIPPGQASPL